MRVIREYLSAQKPCAESPIWANSGLAVSQTSGCLRRCTRGDDDREAKAPAEKNEPGHRKRERVPVDEYGFLDKLQWQ